MINPERIDFLAGDSEMAKRMREFDFSDTPLGPVSGWPQSLRSAVNICLTTNFPIVLFWGPQLAVLYNDAYIPMLADKHPWALGKTCEAVWNEIFDVIGPLLFEVMKTGVPFSTDDFLFIMQRKGYKEETHFQFSYGAARDESGAVGGIFCVAVEITDRVFHERRLAALSNLKSDAKSPMKAAEDAVQILDGHAIDMPFSLIYLINKDGKTASLAGRAGLPAASEAAPVTVDLTAVNEKGWPFHQVAASGEAALVSDLKDLFGNIPARHWPDPPNSAAVLPLMQPSGKAAAGLLVLGISPRRAFDDAYRRFFELASEKITSMILNADAFEQERRRAEALAELDRAKTTFFSNVSHEFRTPLTLMLGPMEELLLKAGADLPPDAREQVSLAHRNGLRLLKLVNTLLDFSRIEAGRIQASYEPTDLGSYTAELASVFRSAIEKAGLRLNVDCVPLPEPVFIDCEMWEKIVLNLLSNAFKFTFEGDIDVKLCLEGSCAVLKVRDTGVGIPAEEMPRLFERFHRIQNMRSRTHEGSGIGLALVQELVRIHGGTIHAKSSPGIGTTFTITLPLGKEHLPQERIGSSRTLSSTAVGASPFVEEALRWLPEEPISGDTAPLFLDRETLFDPCPAGAEENAGRPVILIADDNADMCLYLARILAKRCHVVTVPDGLKALSAAREQRPDLILSDVMMPNLDGFGLVREIRVDDALKTVPVILLSARAGEESRVEGLEYGADDYLIKPFSARELLARVAAHLDMARKRKESAELIRQSEERLRALVTASSDVVYRMSPDWSEMRYLIGKDFIPDTNSPSDSWLDKYIHPEDQKHVLSVINESIRTKGVFELEHRVLQVDGSLGWTFSRAVPLLDSKGEIEEWIGTASDITGRKLAEEALRESERKYQELMKFTPVAIYEVDLRIQRFLSVNDAMCRISGYDREELLAMNILDLLNGQSKNVFKERQIRWLNGEYPEPFAEFKVVRKDGHVIDALLNMSFIFDENGRPIGATVIAQDITERKRDEKALRESEENLKEELAGTKILQRISTEMLLGVDDRAIYEKLLNAAIEIMHSEFASIQMLVDGGDGKKKLYLLAHRGFSGEAAEFWKWVSVSSGSTCGEALRSGRRILIPDVEDCDFMRGTEDLNTYLKTGIHGCQTTPLMTRNGRVVGMMSTHWRGPYEATERQLRFLDVLSRQAADFIERRKTEEALRESEERYAYFLKLSDILRPLNEVKSICDAVTSLLAGHLRASEPRHNEIMEDSITIQSEMLIDSKPGLSGTYKLSSFPAALAIMGTGRNLVMPDVLTFPGFSQEDRERGLALNFRAIVSVPFIKDGKLIGTLEVRQNTPRNWTQQEIDLIRETADRAGLAVERVKAEEALREADERFRTMADAAPVLIWEADTTGVVFVNHHYLDFLGVDFDAVREMGWARFLHPEDAKGYIAIYQEAFFRRESYTYECRFRRADGCYRWLLNTGLPLGDDRFVGSSSDITERKRAEEEQKVLGESLATEVNALNIFHRINTGFIKEADASTVYRDILDAAIILTAADCANMQMVADDGMTLEIIAHKGYSNEFVRRYSRISGMKAICSQAMEERSRIVVEDVSRCTIFDEENRQFMVSEGIVCVQTTPMFSVTGELLGMMSTHYKSPHMFSERELRVLDLLSRQAADVIERVRIEEALRENESRARELVKELEKADRNKNQFISVLSHELRNPLAAILAGIQVLELTQDMGHAREVKEIINRQTKQLCKLVDNLLELTRISQNKIKLKKKMSISMK